MITTSEVDPNESNVPRSRRGAETRTRLVKAAKSVFEEKGFHEARVADVAERAGLSHGSFYHYFDSKDEIFREVAATIDTELSAGMRIILDRESTATPGSDSRRRSGSISRPTAKKRAS